MYPCSPLPVRRGAGCLNNCKNLARAGYCNQEKYQSDHYFQEGLEKEAQNRDNRNMKSPPAFLEIILDSITEGAFTIKKELVIALKSLRGLNQNH